MKTFRKLCQRSNLAVLGWWTLVEIGRDKMSINLHFLIKVVGLFVSDLSTSYFYRHPIYMLDHNPELSGVHP